MPLSTEVIIRKDDIAFPGKCVVCGGTVENQHARLRGSPVGFHGVIPVFWQVIRPLPFQFTHHARQFKLMFLDPSYAREAAALNDGEMEGNDESGNEATP